MKDKVRLALVTVVAAAVAVTMVLFSLTIGLKGRTLEAFAPLITAVVLAVGIIWILGREREKIKKGLPMEDERSKRVKERAGFYAFIAGVWFNLGLLWYNSLIVEEFGVPELITRHALSASILAMAIFFFIFWWYFNRKGE